MANIPGSGRLPIQLTDEKDMLTKHSRHGRRNSVGRNRRKTVDGGQSRVGMDYSYTYRENEVLAVDLEEKLDSLVKDESRVLADKGEKMQEIRKQIEVIHRLQEAVNASKPGESAALLHNTRSTHYGDNDGNSYNTAKLSKTQLRIIAEREKFSAKNLFNRRTPASTMETNSAAKFLTAAALRGPKASDPKEEESAVDALTPAASPGGDQRALNREQSFYRPKTAKQTKGYLRETRASQHGRPTTAMGIVGGSDDLKYDDLLPPRSQSAFRSRSRRELEILSRIAVKDNEPLVDENGMTDWAAVFERRRRVKLQHLRSQGEQLQTRVKSFVTDLERFIKKRPLPVTAWD